MRVPTESQSIFTGACGPFQLNHNHRSTMNTLHKTAASLLISLFMAGVIANAQPANKQSSPIQTSQEAEALCSICSRLAKANPPVAAKVNGRVYDPNLTCHRELRFKPTANGKGPQNTIECICR